MFTININKQTKIKKDIKSLKSSDILSKGTTEKIKSQKGELLGNVFRPLIKVIYVINEKVSSAIC